jgi:arginase family enzyme
LQLAGPVYVSVDLDVLEPGVAPGLSHWEPGGLTTREVLRYIQALPAPIVGADVVEFNPVRDRSGLTAMVAAKIVKELLGKMIAGAEGLRRSRPLDSRSAK